MAGKIKAVKKDIERITVLTAEQFIEELSELAAINGSDNARYYTGGAILE
ncbi:MAG: hypothetical protein ABIN67_09685 [Ferruginibacter sp.]